MIPNVKRSIERLLDHVRRDPCVILVYLFGSQTRDEGNRARDVDIAVLLDRKLTWEEERRLRSEIDVAAGCEIDLVLLRDAGVVLRHEVVTGGRCLWARHPREQAEFEIQAISQFLDFQPMLRLQDDYLRARVEERLRGIAR
jgi:predicted nucleotidyltransferase